MVSRLFGLLFLFALPTVCSCVSYIPFTNQLRTQFHLEPEDIKRVQFYTSADFSLRRDVTSEGSKLTPGGVIR